MTLLKDDEDVTDIEFLELFGYPVATTNMSELKKKGQIARIEQLQTLILNLIIFVFQDEDNKGRRWRRYCSPIDAIVPELDIYFLFVR